MRPRISITGSVLDEGKRGARRKEGQGGRRDEEKEGSGGRRDERSEKMIMEKSLKDASLASLGLVCHSVVIRF